MNCMTKNLIYSPVNFIKINRTFTPSHLFKHKFHISSCKNAKSEEKPSEEIVRVEDVLEDLKEPELTEEELLQKRFKSRLPERVYKAFILREPPPIRNKYDLVDYRLRTYWARFGNKSKLNPGLCWPTREKILETMEYDKTFEPSLQERLRNVREKQQEQERLKQEYEAEVDRNMANHDKWLAEFHDKNQKKEDKIRQLRLDREKLVEEISEYLGYDIDPKDPRFKEAVEQRDKEKKKAAKAKKQQESYEKMLEKLRKIAQQKS